MGGGSPRFRRGPDRWRQRIAEAEVRLREWIFNPDRPRQLRNRGGRHAPDLRGQRFGRLTVRQRCLTRPSGAHRPAFWVCDCDCGTRGRIVRTSQLRHRTRSCGCLQRELSSQRMRTAPPPRPPRRAHGRRIDVRFGAQGQAAIAAAQRATGLPRAVLLRELVREGLERHRSDVRAWSERIESSGKLW